MYKQQHLDEINQSIQDLSMGKRVTRVTHKTATGSETIEYTEADLDALRRYRDDVASNVNGGLQAFTARTRKTL
ncbi:gpW family head-tail joining protein [Piscirickettsia litoralis]|uniref:Phage tail protein n=1 Tax=Piscirickettsia litoralis TaxID=1891921 RepID=A0ABX2ZY66_9GAMM|nr:gpW family head-tail joining protein [Piscirickettsia litoralis]ODN41566.1 hypothetical protein BGC07_15780 [Piscirickettsia litoralis]